MKMFEPEKLKDSDCHIALFGYGYWGQKIASTLEKMKKKHIVIDPSFFKSNHEFEKAQTTILKNQNITHAIVAIPTVAHFPLAKQLLRANKHVFVEKPLVLSVPQCEELIALSTKMKKVVFVDYIFLFQAEVKKIKEILEKGELGKILSVVSTRFSPGFIKPGLQVYEDLLIHDLYLAEYFFDNQIKEIVKLDLKKIGEQTTEIKVEFTVHDAIWQSETSWEEQTLKRELKITGKNGVLHWVKRSGGDEVTMKLKNQPIKVAELSAKESSLAFSINHFLQLNYQTATEKYSAYLRHTRMLESLK